MSWYNHLRALMDASINRTESEMHAAATALHDEFEKIFGGKPSAPAPAPAPEAPVIGPGMPDGGEQQ